jgi:hypothetical protein
VEVIDETPAVGDGGEGGLRQALHDGDGIAIPVQREGGDLGRGVVHQGRDTGGQGEGEGGDLRDDRGPVGAALAPPRRPGGRYAGVGGGPGSHSKGEKRVQGLYEHYVKTDRCIFYSEGEELSVGDTMVVSRAIVYQQATGAAMVRQASTPTRERRTSRSRTSP